jgi:hypothetical protein
MRQHPCFEPVPRIAHRNRSGNPDKG